MRKAFSEAFMAQCGCPELIFLTGDLGYLALESIRETLGSRFINAGVAEQNMVSVSAGLAQQSFRPWVYSIAPFLYARAFEQIRNDICLHSMPVVLVGNGGGYGYGVMGATHHALEDYGLLLTLPSLTVEIPCFNEDLATVVPTLMHCQNPAYLRLGLCEKPSQVLPPKYSPRRKLIDVRAGVLIAVGPLAGVYWKYSMDLPVAQRPNLWCLSQLPVTELPEALWADLAGGLPLVIAEEHVQQGSAGQSIAMSLLKAGSMPSRISHRTAMGYPSGLYGSQSFHRQESRLDSQSVLAEFFCQ